VALGPELFLHLRSKAVHQHHLDAHRVNQREILRKRGQLAGSDEFTGDGHHESLAAVRMDIRRHRAKPRDKGMWEDQAHRGTLK